MNNLKAYAITIATLCILLFTHTYGMSHHLYMTYWYYDIITHLLAGVSLALSIHCFAIIFNINHIKNNLWTLVFLSFIAGIAWEVLEIKYNIAGYKLWTLPYYLDTVHDLVNDVLGAGVVWAAIKFKK